MYGAVYAPILGDTQTQDVAVLAIYIRLFCTANVAVIAAITATCWGGFPEGWGLCTPHPLGYPNTRTDFYYI